MMKMILQYYYSTTRMLEKLRDIPLLLIRLVLAYGFYGPAKMKWSDMSSIVEWFRGMGFPAPALNAYLAASTEAAGVVLLTLGLGTRIISIPLMIVMLVAIKTVHWSNGFEAGNNGFEIPLYYLIMLLVLLINGAGKFSLDRVVDIRCRK
ncbi:MAG TPA: DoxX family protein [Chitinophaga sp.]|uniref:HvfX family Cu-binding RiPP maturation protein n=1 Tax=Chitinophaga sp. TaxID=1869181 RepID=UPI002C3BC684|nr:DoxX family protein [Chitinophaga sp.]HVI48223.1 DoxX family protein [Chitinophaga sp.]